MKAYEPAHMANLVIIGGAQSSLELNEHLAPFRPVALGDGDRRQRLDGETNNTF